MGTIEELKSQRQEHPLRRTLKEAGITTEDVALHLGVSAVTVQNWLRGTYKPKQEQEEKLNELKRSIEAELNSEEG